MTRRLEGARVVGVGVLAGALLGLVVSGLGFASMYFAPNATTAPPDTRVPIRDAHVWGFVRNHDSAFAIHLHGRAPESVGTVRIAPTAWTDRAATLEAIAPRAERRRHVFWGDGEWVTTEEGRSFVETPESRGELLWDHRVALGDACSRVQNPDRSSGPWRNLEAELAHLDATCLVPVGDPGRTRSLSFRFGDSVSCAPWWDRPSQLALVTTTNGLVCARGHAPSDHVLTADEEALLERESRRGVSVELAPGAPNAPRPRRILRVARSHDGVALRSNTAWGYVRTIEHGTNAVTTTDVRRALVAIPDAPPEVTELVEALPDEVLFAATGSDVLYFWLDGSDLARAFAFWFWPSVPAARASVLVRVDVATLPHVDATRCESDPSPIRNWPDR